MLADVWTSVGGQRRSVSTQLLTLPPQDWWEWVTWWKHWMRCFPLPTSLPSGETKPLVTLVMHAVEMCIGSCKEKWLMWFGLDFFRCASTQEQLFLRAVITEFRRLGLEEATFQQVRNIKQLKLLKRNQQASIDCTWNYSISWFTFVKASINTHLKNITLKLTWMQIFIHNIL